MQVKGHHSNMQGTRNKEQMTTSPLHPLELVTYLVPEPRVCEERLTAVRGRLGWQG